MLEEEAIVIRIKGDTVYLKRGQLGACGHCMQQKTCATALLGKLFPEREMPVRSHLQLAVGDKVTVSIEARHLLRASLLVYLLPLLLMLIATGLYEGSDQATALVAVGTLACGFLLVNWLQKRFVRWLIASPQISKKT